MLLDGGGDGLPELLVGRVLAAQPQHRVGREVDLHRTSASHRQLVLGDRRSAQCEADCKNREHYEIAHYSRPAPDLIDQGRSVSRFGPVMNQAPVHP